jgi:hypothetical protein
MTDSEQPRDLIDYQTAERIGFATAEQLADSIDAARKDGGAGVIRLAFPHWDIFAAGASVRFYSKPPNFSGRVRYSPTTDVYVLGEVAK